MGKLIKGKLVRRAPVLPRKASTTDMKPINRAARRALNAKKGKSNATNR